MNDLELEQRLAALRPAAPPPELMRRLRQARPAPAGRVISWPGWLARAAVPLAAAAALALWLAVPPPMPAPSRYEARGAQDFILSAEPVGIGHDEAGRPYRLVRSYGLRRTVWRNAADGTEVAMVEPQQQLLLAKMDVY